MSADLRPPLDKQPAANSPQFPTTMWSMIHAAKNEDEALMGLERLGCAYWKPLYAYARRRGDSHETAADKVQGFFEHLLSHEMLKNVQRGEVRFRSFLLRCFTNWLVNEHHRSQAAKRGGGMQMITMEEIDLERHESTLIDDRTPECVYDRRWARALVDRAMQRLDDEISQKERSDFLQEVRRRVFAAGSGGPDWEEVARLHGLSHGAVRKAVSDLRRRFGVLLRREVRSIVIKDEEVTDELRYLVNLLSKDT